MTTRADKAKTIANPRPMPAALTPFDELGNMIKFGLGAFRGVPTALRLYPSEVLRQAGVLVLSSGVVTGALLMFIAIDGSVFGYYVLNSLGAGSYQGLFLALGLLKATSGLLFGLMVAAKIGCGFVAELGSMRITEEIDALQVMGIHPRSYLVSTRVLAFLVVAPFLFFAAMGLAYITGWVASIPMLQATSTGGYWDVFWSFQTPLDLLKATTWAVITGLSAIIVGLYYGYTASGGPVGVGRNTAKSMVANMIIVNFISTLLFQVFFGTETVLPIAN